MVRSGRPGIGSYFAEIASLRVCDLLGKLMFGELGATLLDSEVVFAAQTPGALPVCPVSVRLFPRTQHLEQTQGPCPPPACLEVVAWWADGGRRDARCRRFAGEVFALKLKQVAKSDNWP